MKDKASHLNALFRYPPNFQNYGTKLRAVFHKTYMLSVDQKSDQWETTSSTVIVTRSITQMIASKRHALDTQTSFHQKNVAMPLVTREESRSTH